MNKVIIIIIGLDTYIKNTDDALIELVQDHDGRKKLYSIKRQAEQFKQELDLTIPDKQAEETTTKYAYTYWKVCHNYNIKTSEMWYDHKPQTVTENEDVTVLWDMPNSHRQENNSQQTRYSDERPQN